MTAIQHLVPPKPEAVTGVLLTGPITPKSRQIVLAIISSETSDATRSQVSHAIGQVILGSFPDRDTQAGKWSIELNQRSDDTPREQMSQLGH
jgi:hypothetical protein